MPRLVHRLPTPRLHRPSGQARLRIGGRELWLGAFGSPEATAEYDRIIAEYLGHGRTLPSETATPKPSEISKPESLVLSPGDVTITVLIAEFWEWAQAHYRKPDGSPSREADNFRGVLRRLRKRHGTLPVSQFGPARLLEYREGLIAEGLARRTINGMVRRVRQVFRWGVSREFVSADVLARLGVCPSIAIGR